MDSARSSRDGRVLRRSRHVIYFILYIQHKIPLLIFLLFLAILKQLDATGTSLSIIAMSCYIFHDYVIDSNHVLKLRAGYIGSGAILIAQAMLIMVPNILLGGAYNYYGIAG
jgi:hypothetical protein